MMSLDNASKVVILTGVLAVVCLLSGQWLGAIGLGGVTWYLYKKNQ